jgi:twitching motility protein PilU
MKFVDFLTFMVEKNASDLFLSSGTLPYLKVEGKMRTINTNVLSAAMVKEMMCSFLNEEQISRFETHSELNVSLNIAEVGRFRVNVFRQMGEIALVTRHIKSKIPSVDALMLPPLLKDLIMEQRGLILLVGATGTGKSTTIASMIDHRNRNSAGHIITIEDPIEYVHENKMSLIHQREIGSDTASYEVALKSALRESPDVILIGEIHDAQTMKHAIDYAETGQLCLSTLHSNNANQAIDRILNFFPQDLHHQILRDLSLNLRAIISQRLPEDVDGNQVAAVEVMLNTPYIKDLISVGNVGKIKEAMAGSQGEGCQTFDQALFDLVQSGRVAEHEALRFADSSNNLALRLKLERNYEVSDTKIRDNVSFNHFVNFDYYHSFRVKSNYEWNNTNIVSERNNKLEEAIRHTLYFKGLIENTKQPDIELSYIFTNNENENENENEDAREVDHAISLEQDIHQQLRKFGLLTITMADVYSDRVIWQVATSRDIVIQTHSQSEINKEVEHMFNEFPPDKGQ